MENMHTTSFEKEKVSTQVSFSPETKQLQKEHEQKIKNLLSDEKKEKTPEGYHVEVMKGAEVPRDIIVAIAQEFREDFGSVKGGGWGEYKKCPCPDCMTKMSIEEYYGLKAEEYIPLKELEKIDVLKSVKCPTHTTDLVDFWPLSEKIHEFESKFQKEDAQVAILFDIKNDVAGYTIGYTTTMEDAWREEFLFLCIGDGQSELKTFLKGCKVILGDSFNEQNKVWIWNPTGIALRARTRDNSYLLRRRFVENMPMHCLEYTSPVDTSLSGGLVCNMIPAGMVTIMKSPKFQDVIFVLLAQSMSSIKNICCLEKEDYDLTLGKKYATARMLQKNNWNLLGKFPDLEDQCIKQISPVV